LRHKAFQFVSDVIEHGMVWHAVASLLALPDGGEGEALDESPCLSQLVNIVDVVLWYAAGAPRIAAANAFSFA